MNLRYLEILEAIAQTGTFTGAAKKLYLTQSAVSHAIAQLELQTGTALFDRLPKGVRLTQCGSLLLEEAKGILSSCRELDGRMHKLEEHAPVTLVSSITIASYWLPKILHHLRQEKPKTQVKVRVVSAANAMGILQRGEADLALIEGAVPQQGLFHSVPFGSYRLNAACAPDFPLPAQVLTPRELCTLPLLLREPGSAIRDTLDSALYLSHQIAHPLWESVNSNALMEAAKEGLGITILPELLLAERIGQGELRTVDLNGLDMENQMLAVWYRDKYTTHGMQDVLDALGVSLSSETALEQEGKK